MGDTKLDKNKSRGILEEVSDNVDAINTANYMFYMFLSMYYVLFLYCGYSIYVYFNEGKFSVVLALCGAAAYMVLLHVFKISKLIKEVRSKKSGSGLIDNKKIYEYAKTKMK